MVHFSHRLRDNIYTEWEHEYMEYKKLKKVLNKKVRATCSTTSSSSARSSTKAFNHKEQWQFQTAPSSPSIVGTDTYRSEMQPLVSSCSEFEELIEMEYEKVENAYKRHLKEFSDQFDLLSSQYRSNASNTTTESMKYSLVELHRLLHQLHNFAILNYTGFIKILKKHDKLLQKSLRKQHIHQYLQNYSFSNAQECQQLIAKLETFFANCFTDGNRQVAMATLMTRKEAFIHWGHIYIGVKIGSCLVLLTWVVWDSIIVPSFPSGNERHIIDLALTRAYPVYRGIGGLLLLHWLIGLSMFVWRTARINYRYIFEIDPRKSQSYTQVFNEATNMTIVFLLNVLLYYKVVNQNFPERILHRGYYPLLLFGYSFYFYVIRSWRAYKGLWKTILEIVCSPLFPVSFFHTFVGDYLTSTVKVNQDLSWSLCFFLSKEFLLPDSEGAVASSQRYFTSAREVTIFASERWRYDRVQHSCSTNYYYVNVVTPLICALPLWWRFLQSLRRIHDTQKWWPNFPNAIKYALAQVVALFGIFHPFYPQVFYHIQSFQIVWVFLFTISSLYTWVWDVGMDWGLGRPQYNYLGDRHMFGRLWVYYVAIVADLFLRFSWTLSLVPPNTSSTLPLYLQPFTMVLELFRRTFWSFFRLENEHLRNTQGFRRVDFIPLHYEQGVGEDKTEDRANRIKPMEAKIFWMKILLIIFLVLALSLAVILIEQGKR